MPTLTRTLPQAPRAGVRKPQHEALRPIAFLPLDTWNLPNMARMRNADAIPRTADGLEGSTVHVVMEPVEFGLWDDASGSLNRSRLRKSKWSDTVRQAVDVMGHQRNKPDKDDLP